MKARLPFVIMCLLLVTLLCCTCGADRPTPDTWAEDPVLRLLHFVPDTPQYREWLTYGDAVAWHSSWDIPRIDSWEELERLEREPRAYWINIMGKQTSPPDSLGIQYLHREDQRSFYGFDLFNLDRFLSAGSPPDWLTVVELGSDGQRVADALIASGYKTETLETGETLFSVLEDYETALDWPMHTGRTGNLNRITLLDPQMIIAKATANVTSAIAAYHNQAPALADNPDYVAAVTALRDPVLDETGELVGVILMEGTDMADPGAYRAEQRIGEPSEPLELQLQSYTEGPPLPDYRLLAFSTHHVEGASYLVLVLVFPKGTDAAAAADVLAGRLRDYYSLSLDKPLNEYWTFEMSVAVEAKGLPVVLAVMRVDDPPPTSEDTPQVNATILSWLELVVRHDTMFLITGH
jgi:hypothetical protein